MRRTTAPMRNFPFFFESHSSKWQSHRRTSCAITDTLNYIFINFSAFDHTFWKRMTRHFWAMWVLPLMHGSVEDMSFDIFLCVALFSDKLHVGDAFVDQVFVLSLLAASITSNYDC